MNPPLPESPPGATPAENRRPFVDLRQIHKAMGRQRILRGVDLAVYPGETLAVIGPSGEGKTVMVKHIIGLLRPDSGTVLVDGVEVHRLRERQLTPVRRKVGMLFQNAALFDRLTVEENVAFPLHEAGVRDRDEVRQRVHEALEVVDLAEHKDKLPVNLSGGMRKRAGIARAVVTRAQCIIYDEPTASLDPVVSDVIDQMILRLQRRFGVTSIVVTHDMKSVFKIANRVAMLKDGIIRFCGTVEALQSSAEPDIRDFIEGRSHVQG